MGLVADVRILLFSQTHLALYCFANNQITTALKLLYRARYLTLVVIGENHPEVALLDSNIGLILHAVGEYDLSLRFLEKALALNKKYYGIRSLKGTLLKRLITRLLCFNLFLSWHLKWPSAITWSHGRRAAWAISVRLFKTKRRRTPSTSSRFAKTD